MCENWVKWVEGHAHFQKKYAAGQSSAMALLARNGQSPKAMVIACCDSRVDPALLLQCDPGDIFVVRHIASLVPPYGKSKKHFQETKAALEYGITTLQIPNLILLGHSQCAGIDFFLHREQADATEFLLPWLSLLDASRVQTTNVEEGVKCALEQSHENCLSYPWICQRQKQNQLTIQRWFFDIAKGQLFAHDAEQNRYLPLDALELCHR